MRNLQNGQIYFNNPLNFNDPFDTFHPAKITEISNERFVDLYCKSIKRKLDKNDLIGILEGTISKEDFYNFCEKHIDYILDFKQTNENQIFKSKFEFLNQLKSIENSEIDFIENIGSFFKTVKLRLQTTIQETLSNIRQETFSKIGVCCFSKNNSNLLMWSYYADSHQGICLEFDSNFEPFSKAFNVEYKTEIPDVSSDLLFSEKETTESIKKFLSIKSIDWKHEEEIRVFHQESNKSYFYTNRSLKAIYFGIRTNQSDIEMICSIIKAKNPGVKFYKMKKQEVTFGIEAEQFFYSTVIEVQSSLILIISSLFNKKEFTQELLLEKGKIDISKIQLKAHLEDLKNKNIL
ncbi:MAG: DUF2971 domain-containing protein, partial [Flavobacteriaceae bacterium]|nr:DUF2971 domain-containing protein [Flavobacteriaceae bacterium]